MQNHFFFLLYQLGLAQKPFNCEVIKPSTPSSNINIKFINWDSQGPTAVPKTGTAREIACSSAPFFDECYPHRGFITVKSTIWWKADESWTPKIMTLMDSHSVVNVTKMWGRMKIIPTWKSDKCISRQITWFGWARRCGCSVRRKEQR